MGAAGFIGSAVVQRLFAGRWHVTACVRESTPREWVAEALSGAELAVLSDGFGPPELEWLLREKRADIIINCIGAMPTGGPDNPASFYAAHVDLTRHLLYAADKCRVGRVLTLGSGFEYLPLRRPTSEDDQTGPTTPYGMTKLEGSANATRVAAITGMDVCVVRPFSVFGPREKPSRFVPYVVTRALAGEDIEMSTGDQLRDYLYVEDLADALVAAAGHAGRLPPVLNVSGPQIHPLVEVAQVACELAGSGSRVLVGRRPPNEGDREVFLGDSALARRVLGWQPTRNLRAGLIETIEWYRSHRQLWEAYA